MMQKQQTLQNFWSRLIIIMPKKVPRTFFLVALCVLGFPALVWAAPDIQLPGLQLTLAGNTPEPEKVSVLLEILFVLTVLSVAPSIVLTVTSFTRIIIVFSFLRQAMGV